MTFQLCVRCFSHLTLYLSFYFHSVYVSACSSGTCHKQLMNDTYIMYVTQPIAVSACGADEALLMIDIMTQPML